MRRTVALAAAVVTLVTGTIAPAVADEALRIEAKANDLLPGSYTFSIRNVGAGPVRIEGGRLNGRDDCTIVPATIHTHYSEWGDDANFVDHYLSSIAGLKSRFEGSEGVKVLYAPFEMQVGEAAFLVLTSSPCSENGSEVVQITIRTTEGEYSFSR